MRRGRSLNLIPLCYLACAIGWPSLARGATFGQVVAINGQAADLALDESRGVLYVANFTAGRIDVLSLSDNTVHTSMHVAAAPASLAMSVDGRFLAVTHFGNVLSPGSPSNALTVIDLSSSARQIYALDSPPLGVAFGSDGLALIATTTEFLHFDALTGRVDVLSTIANLTANSIPAAPGTAPVQIVAASLAASGDGKFIFGLADTIRFVYDVSAKRLQVTGYTASPPLGPRVVSVSGDGSYYLAGWGLFNLQGNLLAQFPGASGQLAVGSHAIDSGAGILYAQIPQTGADPNVPAPLWIADADNLTVRERLNLPENLTGRSLLNEAADTLYAVSESGVMVLPVGSLNQFGRLIADHEDLVFRGSFCQQGAIVQNLRIVDPGGGQTNFSLSSDLAGVSITPSAGHTPSVVQVTVDPRQFQDRRGTVTGSLKIISADAVNVPMPVRILVNNQRPDERGSPTNVPGTLSDLLADPDRDRFYILRQDRNLVLVFDGSGLFPIAQLRTSNTPTRMAITPVHNNLLVGHDNSQQLYVFDLNTLQQLPSIMLPAGHYPRSIAAAGNAIFVASRGTGGTNTIDQLSLVSQTASTLPSLGVFQNSVNADTMLVATPSGGSMLAVSADGNLLLYDAAAGTFTVSRKLPTSVAGAVAASDSGQFVAGNNLLNSALKPVETWTGSDFPSGFAFVDGLGVRLTGPAGTTVADGSIERIDLANSSMPLPTRVAEQPLIGGGISVLTRTVAPLANRNTLIALTTSGFTALPWQFDTAVAPPAITQVVNAADLTANFAPGSLIAVFGTNLNPTNMVSSQIPLPTALGESCLTLAGTALPMSFASPGQINAQLPLHVTGLVPLTLYTPGGVSDDFYVNLTPTAPAIFQSGTAGPLTGIPLVIKVSNAQLITPTNPIHPSDEISIYATGLGATSPEVAVGTAAPSNPLAAAVAVPDVRLGNLSMNVSYAGLAPGLVGVFQINARAPAKAPSGTEVPLTVSQGGVTTSVNVRVVN
ncbi:MAG TPA: hypothetical protein VKU19_27020 [Bryobacteraceae bacterium]|nr:hypothetical protein [Bryobacteraceae bacterium]